MTFHATHRFNVGQLVSCPGNDPAACKVTSQIAGPAYEVEFVEGGQRKVVPEGELIYRNHAEAVAAARLGNLTRSLDENSALAIRWRRYAAKSTLAPGAHEAMASIFDSCAQAAHTEIRALKRTATT
jgi:hypothetical protein